MDLQSLQAFCAVAEQGSFSGAAQTLFLTQPAISKRVAWLEQQLGARLFDRIGRHIQLTEAGRLLLPRAHRILRELADSRRLIAELGGQVAGELRLATSHHIGLHRLPPLLKAFADRYPEVALRIQFLDSEGAYQEVLQGEHDLAVVTLAPHSQPQLVSETWWQDELDFVAAPNHPLTRIEPLALADFSRFNAILPDERTHTTALIRQLFERAGAVLDVHLASNRLTSNYLDTIKMMVSIGLGWSLLPRTLVDASLRVLKPKGLPNGGQLARQLGCIYHRSRSQSNAARAFIAMAHTDFGVDPPL